MLWKQMAIGQRKMRSGATRLTASKNFLNTFLKNITMSLSEALVHQGYDPNYVHEIVDLMHERVAINFEWPDDVLLDYGLDPNYIFQLLNVKQCNYPS